MAGLTVQQYARLLFLRVLVPALIDLALGLLLVSITFLVAGGLARVSSVGVAVVAVHAKMAAIGLGGLYVLSVLLMAFRRHVAYYKLAVQNATLPSEPIPVQPASAEGSRPV